MKIALLDDNSTILLTTEAMMRKCGALKEWDQFLKYDNAEKFLEEFRGDDEFGVIIIDHDLGDDQIKGYELISLVQSEGYKNKAILFTGDDSMRMNLKMAFAHHVDYVVKGNKEQFEILAKLIEEARDA